MTAATLAPADVLDQAADRLRAELLQLAGQLTGARLAELVGQLRKSARRASTAVRKAQPPPERPPAKRPVSLGAPAPNSRWAAGRLTRPVSPAGVTAILPATSSHDRGDTTVQQQPAQPPPPSGRWWNQPPPSRPPTPPLPPPAPRSRVPHAVTWPAVGVTVLALVVASTSRVIDYQTVILVGTLALLASIAGAVVSVMHRHTALVIVAAVAVVLAAVVLYIGIEAMGQYQDIMRDLRRGTS